MTGFTDLNLQKDGVGTYNLNRFRIAFRSRFGPQYLAQLLISSFAGYFNGPAATVRRTEGDKLQFHGNIPIGRNFMPTPHSDWVRVVFTNPRHGFTVQTLHRDSLAAEDFVVEGSTIAGGAVVGGVVLKAPGAIAGAAVGAVGGLAETTRLNRYHFLAGRRGWRVDFARAFGRPGDGEPFDPTGATSNASAVQNDLIFETAAIERSSSVEIEKIKPLMTPLVIQIWTHMLTKFAGMSENQVLPPSMWPLEPGWRRRGQVHYTWQEHASLSQLMGSPDFAPMQRLYPYIYQAASD